MTKNRKDPQCRLIMPRAMKVCPIDGCIELIPASKRHCAKHEKEARPPDARPTSAKRGYDARWRKIRKDYLEASPFCVDCMNEGIWKLATEVDHVLPLADGGTHDVANLEGRCKSHHSSKTAKFDGGFGNIRKIFTDGKGRQNR
jgi:5-methylcytosine-specific restriction protein A